MFYKVKKEFIVFIGTFIILSLLMHFAEFLSFPLTHINNLGTSGAYGFGSFHPLIFTLLIYIVIFIPRFIYRSIFK
ncbi:hypothetical protein [Poseidonibacter lekithochrous]|uniref:hypothetical protein n=1 Tax=Poseidonibacter lekithochrous TaxID=1904463 RepID=UPI000B271F41|nr:hypothetical protein [Poseidonibacter lekithochrous]QKJ21562.1 putative membrane protein [Poseidonibacter lekithochrous]